MKNLANISIILMSILSSASLHAIPIHWDVELSAQPPQVFTLQRPRGETYELQAVLKRHGKPFEPDITNACIYWQTNGMENLYWSAPATVSNNCLRAVWLPEMDPGATTVRGYIGDPGHIYAAAFQFRFIASPGATPNELPLPTPVIDFAQVTVLNPPWPDGVDTNAVKAIIDAEVGGTNAVKSAVSDVAAIKATVETKRDMTDLSFVCQATEDPRTDDGRGKTSIVIRYDGTDETLEWVTRDGKWSSRSFDYTPQDGGNYLLQMFDGSGMHYNLNVPFGMTGDVTLTDGIVVRIVGMFYDDSIALVSQLPETNQLLTAEQRTAIDDSATKDEVDEAKAAANDANVWSMATYNFMTGGRTNCWFSGTNYVFGADAETRTRFAWEDGMDAATVPCSMALWEIRDGVRQLVWDQRDWTAWYWSFKAAQMAADIQGRIDALSNAVTNDANYAWSKRYASDGTPNPDSSTTFIDTPSVTLSPGMKWETVATVSGASYWTIVGNGAIIGGSGTNAVLRIMDFEGNDIMTVTKGEHRLAWLEKGDITDQMYDSDGWVCFDMLADAEPVGYFSTTLEMSDFLPQTDPNCPAQYLWENIGGGKYRVHFLLKPGIQANACFAKFQVEVEGQTVIRYNAGQEISGGLIYDGVKIAPEVSGSPAVGTVIQWKVVP